MSDEEYYLIATNEVDGEDRNEALWAKSIALVDGDESKARYEYIKLRVPQLESKPDTTERETPHRKFTKVTSSSNQPADSFSLEYIEVERFAKHKSISVEKAIEMIRDGFYSGRLKDEKWYVHRQEITDSSASVKPSTQKTSEVEFVPVAEFSEFKGISTEKAIEMIRDGFYQGRLLDGEWFVSYSEISTNNPQGSDSGNFFQKLVGGHYGLPKTYWLFGVLGGYLFNKPIDLVAATGSLGAVIFVALISVVYSCIVLVGIWRASDLYGGPKIWSGLAKLAVIFACICIFASLIALANAL